MIPTEDFGQLRLKFTDTIQHHYEVIRRIVLYSETVSERTVGRAMALNRQYHNAPEAWQSQKDQIEPDTTPKYLPYRPDYRHHIWYLDIRYLVKIDGQWVYSICIIEGYSRAILAGTASEYQDLTAVLQILYAALVEYGCPEFIVTDNAKVFNAHDYQHILKELEVEPKKANRGRI